MMTCMNTADKDNFLVDGNLTIDFTVHAVYLTITPELKGVQLFTIEHNDTVNIDYDISGQVYGIELLTMKHGFPVEELAEQGSDLWKEIEEANRKLAVARESFKDELADPNFYKFP